jgi:nitrogen fixation protein NifQ
MTFPASQPNSRFPLTPAHSPRGEGVTAAVSPRRDAAPLSPDDVYRNLMEARAPGCDEFDAHTVASILAISSGEAQGQAQPQTSAAGLTGEQFGGLIAELFPKSAAWRLFERSASIEHAADEACLLVLLERCTTSRTPFEMLLAAMIARRAQRHNHLWQDLGFRNRGELSQLMMRHFKPLARRNTQDMKWKKFFYRLICADASYTLCTAPSCAECGDFGLCFGEETGESLLARTRRTADLNETG